MRGDNTGDNNLLESIVKTPSRAGPEFGRLQRRARRDLYTELGGLLGFASGLAGMGYDETVMPHGRLEHALLVGGLGLTAGFVVGTVPYVISYFRR